MVIALLVVSGRENRLPKIVNDWQEHEDVVIDRAHNESGNPNPEHMKTSCLCLCIFASINTSILYTW